MGPGACPLVLFEGSETLDFLKKLENNEWFPEAFWMRLGIWEPGDEVGHCPDQSRA